MGHSSYSLAGVEKSNGCIVKMVSVDTVVTVGVVGAIGYGAYLLYTGGLAGFIESLTGEVLDVGEELTTDARNKAFDSAKKSDPTGLLKKSGFAKDSDSLGDTARKTAVVAAVANPLTAPVALPALGVNALTHLDKFKKCGKKKGGFLGFGNKVECGTKKFFTF